MLPYKPDRAGEVTALLSMTETEVRERAGDRLAVFPELTNIYASLADEMIAVIQDQNARNEPTRLILPVGPTGQYPVFVDQIKKLEVDLSSCWFFFMDEYASPDGIAFSPEHPLSFSGILHEKLVKPLQQSGCSLPRQVVVPSHENIDELGPMIDELGGIDACFGGIGIHGHLAFNEPEDGVANSGPRRVQLNDYTTTINAIRAGVGGNLEGFPRQAYTLGMRQILGARKLRLACRNGVALDWANTVLRLTLFGEPGDDYPCTYANEHPDLRIYTDADTLRQPSIIL